MACVTTNQLADIQGDLAAVLLHIAAIDTGLAGPMLAGGIKSYKLDAGTGQVQEVFSSPMEMIALRATLTATRDRLRRSLNGESIMTTRLRR